MKNVATLTICPHSIERAFHEKIKIHSPKTVIEGGKKYACFNVEAPSYDEIKIKLPEKLAGCAYSVVKDDFQNKEIPTIEEYRSMPNADKHKCCIENIAYVPAVHCFEIMGQRVSPEFVIMLSNGSLDGKTFRMEWKEDEQEYVFHDIGGPVENA
jgi:hypothetical protein